MSVLFCDVATIYNYYESEDSTEHWSRSVVKGVQWRHNRNEVSTSNGVQTENKVESITIDFGRRYGNKPYLQPVEYNRLADEERGNYWTLNAKSGKDIVVLGEATEEIGQDCRISELREHYQYVVTVTSVSDNRNMPRLKHIKVVAK